MLRARLALVIAAVTVLAGILSAVANSAGAHSTRRTPAAASLPAAAGLTFGVSGATQLIGGSAASRQRWTQRAQADQASMIRLQVNWSSVAPAKRPSGFQATNPASAGYAWGTVDREVKDLSSEGFTVLIAVVSAPSWAEGAKAPSYAQGAWKPSATAFGQFATALATRYSGAYADPTAPGTSLPAVRYWQAWNEPNLASYISPVWVRSRGALVDEGAIIYRGLLDAFYTAMKKASPQNTVITAGMAPYGDPPGGHRVPPVTFDRDLFCLTAANRATACPQKAEFDDLDQHTYVPGQTGYAPTFHAVNATDVSINDVTRVGAVLKAAQSAHTVIPAGGQGVWVTEVGYQTSPPQPKGAGITLAQDAVWPQQALYLLWSQGVRHVLWYQLGDTPKSSAGWAATETFGLNYANGARKPAYYGLRFPFVTTRVNSGSVEAWGRAPATGTMQIQLGTSAGWRTVLTRRVAVGQVFKTPLKLRGSGRFRAVVGQIDSLSWLQSAG